MILLPPLLAKMFYRKVSFWETILHPFLPLSFSSLNEYYKFPFRFISEIDKENATAIWQQG